jgi:transcriptional regulator with XRE-family HTH domain
VGRAAKNLNQVLVRLRATLLMTRKTLAERTGVSASTIREIETNRFQLSDEVAQKIFRGTGVAPASLLRGDNPLLDISGNTLSSESKRRANFWWISDYGETDAFLLSALLRAAEKVGKAVSVSTEFSGWLERTTKLFGLTDLVRQELTENLESFDQSYVSECFRPKDPKSKKIWMEFNERLRLEHDRIAAELRAAHDPRMDAPIKGMRVLADSRFVNKLARRSLKSKGGVKEEPSAPPAPKLTFLTLEPISEWQQKTSDHSQVKRPSGKQPRSPGRPED